MDTREKIVAAAERVLRDKGIARTTTKEIARAAGYSEGTLYKHFESKEDLFLAVLTERLPSLLTAIEHLPARAGQGSLSDTLAELARMALAFYAETMPMAVSVFAEPSLLASHVEVMKRRGRGPRTPNDALAAYLRAEQRLGRVRHDVDPAVAAATLLGACFQRAFLQHYYSETTVPGEERRFAADIVHALMAGLASDGDRPQAGR